MSSVSKSLQANFYFIGNYVKLMPETAKQLLTKALNNDLPDVKPTQLLVNPDKMQAFVYICTILNDDLFKADDYRWSNGGFKPLGKHGVTVQYNYIVEPPVEPSESKLASQLKDFRKVVFTLTEQNFQKGSPVLIWYIGDKDAVERVLHGNSKIDRHFLPTIASHCEEIKAHLL